MNFYGARNMADSFRTVRNNTIQIAEDIPDDQYGYRVAAGTMSVADTLAHLATGTHWAAQSMLVERRATVASEDFGRYMGEAKAMAAALTNKAAIVAALKANGEAFATQLDAANDELLGEMVALPGASKSRFEVLLGVKEHEMHHRGQLMVVERLIGIVPHLTRARMARMAAQSAAPAGAA